MLILGSLFVAAMTGLVARQLISGKLPGRSWDGAVFATRNDRPLDYWFTIVLELAAVAVVAYFVIRSGVTLKR
jgi:hypothetical protein